MCLKYNDVENSYIPSFPVGSRTNVALNRMSYTSEPNTTYIYSGIECSGVVTAIDYCYRGVASMQRPYFIGTNWTVFSLLVLNGSDNNFIVANAINISTRPTNRNMKCVRPGQGINYCCDTYDVTEEFEISSPNTAFGINVLDSRAELLGWTSTFMEFSIEHYKITRNKSVILSTSTNHFVLIKCYVTPYDTSCNKYDFLNIMSRSNYCSLS